jgi:hypothetical protein
MNLLLAACYVAFGIVSDFMITKYYVAVYRRRRLMGAVLGTLITLLTIYIFDQIITSNKFYLMLAWAVGNGVGTYLGIGE